MNGNKAEADELSKITNLVAEPSIGISPQGLRLGNNTPAAFL